MVSTEPPSSPRCLSGKYIYARCSLRLPIHQKDNIGKRFAPESRHSAAKLRKSRSVSRGRPPRVPTRGGRGRKKKEPPPTIVPFIRRRLIASRRLIKIASYLDVSGAKEPTAFKRKEVADTRERNRSSFLLVFSLTTGQRLSNDRADTTSRYLKPHLLESAHIVILTVFFLFQNLTCKFTFSNCDDIFEEDYITP